MVSRTLKAIAAGIATAMLGAGLAAPAAQAAPAPSLNSKSQLKSLRVPSMCQNPAGTLVNGELPGHHVYLDTAKSKLGQIKKGGGKEAAAVFHCSQGGIGWPDHLVFYGADGSIIGRFDTASVGASGGRQQVSSVAISSKGVITVKVVAVPLKGDNNLWGSAGAKLTFTWDAKKKKVVRTSKKIYSDVRGTAKKMLSLVKAGKLTQAKKYAKASVVNELARTWKHIKKDNKSAKRKGGITIGKCNGTFASGANSWMYDQHVPYGSRGCEVTITWPMRKGAIEQYESGYLLVLDHKASDKNWASWYARDWIGVAG